MGGRFSCKLLEKNSGRRARDSLRKQLAGGFSGDGIHHLRKPGATASGASLVVVNG